MVLVLQFHKIVSRGTLLVLLHVEHGGIDILALGELIKLKCALKLEIIRKSEMQTYDNNFAKEQNLRKM